MCVYIYANASPTGSTKALAAFRPHLPIDLCCPAVRQQHVVPRQVGLHPRCHTAAGCMGTKAVAQDASASWDQQG